MPRQKLVIFRNISGKLCVTPVENYNRRVRNIWYIQIEAWAKRPVDIVNHYCKNYRYRRDDFLMGAEPLKSKQPELRIF